MVYCVVGLRSSLLLLIFLCICPIFFLSILWMMKFLSTISVKLCKLEYSYLVCRLIMMYCIVGLRASLLLHVLPCICPIFFLSILWMMKFSSKISLKLCKLEYSYLVCSLIMMYCTVGLRTSLLLLILSCIYLFFFLSTFFVKHGYLHNCIE